MRALSRRPVMGVARGGLAALAVIGVVIGALASGCATRARASAPVGDPLVALFPRSDVPLARSAALRMLPLGTLGVVLGPGLSEVRATLERGSGRDSPIITALSALASRRLGHDLLDIERAARLGIDTKAPMAAALLAFDIGVLVLPLADPARFEARWYAPRGTLVAVGERHAAIAFALTQAGVVDTTNELVAGLGELTAETSLAAHPKLLDTAARLGYGPDLVVLLNVDALRPALAQYLSDERDRLDIEAVRDMMDIDELREDATEELILAEREIERLASWQTLNDELATPVSAVAVGVGVGDGAIKARAALGFVSGGQGATARPAWLAPREWPAPSGIGSRVWARGPNPGEISARLRLPADALLPALHLLVDRRAYRRARDMIAAMGGATTLDGSFEVTYAGQARGGPLVAVRMGVRSEARARSVVGAGRAHGAWRVHLERARLVVERRARSRSTSGTGSSSGARIGGRDATDPVRVVASARPAAATSIMDSGLLWPALADPGEWRGDVDGVEDALRGLERDEPLAVYRTMAATRQRIEDEGAQAVAQERDALSQGLGAIAMTLVERPQGPALFAVAATPGSETPDQLLGHALAWWYHQSEYTPDAARLAEARTRMSLIEAEVSKGAATETADEVEDRPLRAPRPPGRSGSTSVLVGPPGATLPGIGTLSAPPRGTGLSPLAPGGNGAGLRARVTASVTRLDGALDRVALDRWLLGAVPGLRRCYRVLRQERDRAGGYMGADLSVDGAAVRVTGVRAADSAQDLDDASMIRCVTGSLEANPAAMPGTDAQARRVGAATITLFFSTE